jgi:hypothetical protein
MIKEFENAYWNAHKQTQSFRHISAKKMLESYGIEKFLDVGSGDGFFINMIQSE